MPGAERRCRTLASAFRASRRHNSLCMALTERTLSRCGDKVSESFETTWYKSPPRPDEILRITLQLFSAVGQALLTPSRSWAILSASEMFRFEADRFLGVSGAGITRSKFFEVKLNRNNSWLVPRDAEEPSLKLRDIVGSPRPSEDNARQVCSMTTPAIHLHLYSITK